MFSGAAHRRSIFHLSGYVRIDPPHNGQGYHINIDSKFLGQNEIYDWLYKKLEHYPLTEDAYHFLKNLCNVQKVVKIAGRILLVAGLALDALEIGLTIYDDLHDADGKLGKETLSTIVSIGGSWGGAKLGAKAGASLGAAANVAAPVVVPVLSLTGGIAGSYLGSALGKWVVDITYAGD